MIRIRGGDNEHKRFNGEKRQGLSRMIQENRWWVIGQKV